MDGWECRPAAPYANAMGKSVSQGAVKDSQLVIEHDLICLDA